MRDPLSWSFPIGRFFGITVRVHLLLLFFSIGMAARGLTHTPSYAAEALLVQGLLFLVVLLHEFGHCFAARWMHGDASEVMLWPLGGLASVDVPNHPWAHFVTAAGGPAVNLILFLASAAGLAALGLAPPINPLWDVVGPEPLTSWATGAREALPPFSPVALLARFFYINWILFWFNLLLVGFPMDGGRILQCILWPRIGYRQATLTVIFSGWIVSLVLALLVVVYFENATGANLLLLFFLALFIYTTCKQQFILLETGALGEDPALGYDFSQGYTSLERDSPRPRPRRRQGFWRRLLERRAERRRQREEERRQAEERRMDELLDKVQRQGIAALTEEERRFLTRVSARYRDRYKY